MSSKLITSRIYYFYLMFFLGLLSAFGPFITDMYLPTLPSMASVFHTTPAKVQMGLSTSMLGLAAGQIFFGPLSDKYGRRNVLSGALLIFSVSTVASVYSTDIDFFNVCRFLQGLGGAGGIVLSRSIATDCYSGRTLAKTMAIIGAINGITPVISPVVGGMVAGSIGWQGIFWVLFGIGIGLLIMTLPFEESLDKERRHKGKVWSLLKTFPSLLSNKQFDYLVLAFAFANGVLFAYISSSAFIIQDYYGFSEIWFSLIFAVNSIGIIIGSSLTLRFKHLYNAAVFGGVGIVVSTLLQLIIYICIDNFYIYESLTLIMLIFIGFIFTSGSAMAMDAGRSHIGAASATLGASGFLMGVLVSPLVGLGDIMLSSIVTTLVCSLICLFFAIISQRNQKTAFNQGLAKGKFV